MATRNRTSSGSEVLLRRIDDLESDLKRARAEFEASSRLSALGLLTGAIAHEFSNILTPVLSYSKAALAHPGDRELAEKALEKAARGVEQASRLANSVLRLAGSGVATDDEPEACDPAQALEGAVGCLERPLADEKIELRVNIPDDLRLRIRQTDLEHVLLNLLLNASRALKPGGGVLEVTCRPTATPPPRSTWNTDGEFAELIVHDSGPGMSRELMAELFEPMLARTSRVPNRSRGNGLGLVICRRLVEAAGGSIGVESELGQGATFRILVGVDQRSDRAAA